MPRKSQHEWHQLIQAQTESSLPVKLFCQQQGISLSCFYKYKAEQNKSSQNKTGSPFVKVAPSAAKVKPSSITIDYQKIHMTLPLSVTPEWCASLLKALA